MIEFIKNLYLQPATVDYCEKIVSGWIKRPFDTAGNIVFLILGIIFLIIGKKSKLSKIFGWTTLVIWLFSSLYDATASLLFQVFDFTAMFIFVTLLISLNLERLGLKISKIYRWIVIILGVIVFLFFRGLSPHIFFGVLVLTVIVSELSIKAQSRKFWYFGITTFITGVLFWLVDLNKLVCDPTKIFNGRNLEHFFFSLAIYLIYAHYHQIKKLNEVELWK